MRIARPVCLSIAAGLLLLGQPGCTRRADAPAKPGSAANDSTLAIRQRLAWLEAQRSFGDGEMQAAARHPDARVRRATAMALGRIQDAEAAPTLIELLRDQDLQVELQAAWGLRQLQGLDESGRQAVETALVEELELASVAEAWPYLEALAPHASPASVPVSAEFVASGLIAAQGSRARPPLTEGMAALALAKAGSHDAKRLLGELGTLLNREMDAAWRLAEALSNPPDSTYFASVLSLLQHPHWAVRATGARALGKFKDERAVEPLLGALADLDWEVRASALRALADIADPAALSFCAALVGDAHALVREAALSALLAFDTPGHASIVRAALQDPVPAVRLAALRVAAKSEGEQARDAWVLARADTVDFVRTEALGVAERVLGAAAVDTLLRALAQPEARERAQAAQALGELTQIPGHAARVRAALESALGDTDFVVATQAAEGLGKRGWTESLPALMQAYAARRIAFDDADVRLAAVEAIGTVAAGKPSDALTRFFANGASEADPRVQLQLGVAQARMRGETPPEAAPPRARTAGAPPESLPPIDLGIVHVRLVTPHGDAILELDGDRFPRTVGDFLARIASGFYDHSVFHRVVPAFVVQGGCPRGDGWGSPGYSVPCEYGDLRYDREGVVGIAHAGKDTGGSQFFITHMPVLRLDGRYTAFGHVIEGMDVVDKIVRGDHFRLERIEVHSQKD
jgi:cyclophilin family peptidyl-prolyl cis-trans isomerase/HEAT repeat protein